MKEVHFKSFSFGVLFAAAIFGAAGLTVALNGWSKSTHTHTFGTWSPMVHERGGTLWNQERTCTNSSCHFTEVHYVNAFVPQK